MNSHMLSSDCYTCAMAHVFTHTHTHRLLLMRHFIPVAFRFILTSQNLIP